ncbi:MAG TPA: hypothetical protein VGX51_11200 [Solirubrobacteraceae bacterium]|jgi:hypothetical protein|nr:hypothetical protein [Solirubrobacteraceae bacterium]
MAQRRDAGEFDWREGLTLLMLTAKGTEEARIYEWSLLGNPGDLEGFLDRRQLEGVEHPPRRLAVTKAEAGELLGGKSVDWIEKYVLPYVRTVKPSRSVLIPVAELERWVDKNSARALRG